MTLEAILTVNGSPTALRVEPTETLLETLRERLHLLGTKDGCSEGECGACTVLVDGEPMDACLLPVLAVVGREITTIEGIGGADGGADRIQDALVRAGAVQCGFCTPGFVMTLIALLRQDATPSRHDIRTAIAGNICRCTGYAQIVEAVAGLADEDDGGVRRTAAEAT
jgi:carbon-monoxide dehydrogenase small subunit